MNTLTVISLTVSAILAVPVEASDIQNVQTCGSALLSLHDHDSGDESIMMQQPTSWLHHVAVSSQVESSSSAAHHQQTSERSTMGRIAEANQPRQGPTPTAALHAQHTSSDLDQWYLQKAKYLKDRGFHEYNQLGCMEPDRNHTRKAYDELARQPWIKTVCEIGFNAGDAALRFLVQSNATLYEFDLGENQYAHEAADFMNKHFPERFHIMWGDSGKTVPEFHRTNPDVRCDLAIVDGGHGYDIALADLTNFYAMVSEQHVLFTDDTPCEEVYCIGVNEAYGKLLAEGCLVETLVHQQDYSYGFRQGKYTPSRCNMHLIAPSSPPAAAK
eukprot:gnl/TRDRNA2_/TRDRNA2_191120_c0_seq1.p1 gnl/TRDRNA2_/TRDRNA2_191120_c0~~gnl/TRDRNA2_/TRDRNA2_191120_c0_seq1.p1  ORF type:complete len:329 (+),score=25.71 gnl/TRDRNA2_/TRDRNA2_191120_c0_seq1:75-1061(+)